LSPAAGFLVQLLLVTQIDARGPGLAYNDIRSGEITKKGALRALGYDAPRKPTMWSTPARSQATAVFSAECNP
jgi:hypothetical protein